MIRILTGMAGNDEDGNAFSFSYGDEVDLKQLKQCGVDVDTLIANQSAEMVGTPKAATRKAPEKATKKAAEKRG